MNHEEPYVDLNLALQHGLSEEEYRKILKFLGRTPTYTELGIYSVMWSEHCSYKNSIALLKTLPRSGGRLLVAAGEENAGLVDIGDGLAVAFKIESHNHPSAVEPYQGAATGVGGILRDIFSMGARPIAILNSLRFGNLGDQRVQYLFKRVVKGIADYGNSFGVPTIAGEVYFDSCYQDNPLVNAMAVGVVEVGKVARAVAKGKGNSVMLVGSSTGRDGIHGATFASEEISADSERKRPSVQVGDPFVEKLLLEATLEAVQSGHIVGVQDMGAAGITCSTTEMSAKGKSGLRIDLDKVPLRETGMTSYEIMLSESQERMLFMVKKGHETEVENIFRKWDLHGVVIGEVQDGELVEVFHQGKKVASVPAKSLVLGGDAPVYTRESREPAYLKAAREFDSSSVSEPSDYNEVLLNLLKSPTIASKKWIFQQYDTMVRTNTVLNAGHDASIVRIKGTTKALALKTDCNSRYVYLNPRRGGEIAVAESARNVVCVGAMPLAITNCLNFGNPYDPEVYWQFKEAVRGIGEACRYLGTPVTGGNVSFYNEGPNSAIFPTPVIGMLGLIEDVDNIASSEFKSPGDAIILLGQNKQELGGSEYLYLRTGKIAGDAPELDWPSEKNLHALCLELVGERLFNSAHDVSEGGMAVALVESILGGEPGLGFDVNPDRGGSNRLDFELFGESQSMIIISTHPDNEMRVLDLAEKRNVPARKIGKVNGSGIVRIGDLISVEASVARIAYDWSIERGLGELGDTGVRKSPPA
ncbi:MAG: phosphoribosylformylglycinamidine synthase subunit PurL [Ignavibacteriales bacterium]|nr:phosphoribosylformylglycinamidine synthase subunit PurL [Ignavibacteriales bacterium]